MALLRTTTRARERIGQTLAGRYRLLAPIGSGASACVYLADDLTLGRRVAVKVLHEVLAADTEFLRRFAREARSAAALNHPNITAVYDWGGDDPPFLVMEQLAGGSLRAMLDRTGALSTGQALVIGLEAARGLDYAHRRGFVHRDIKPANLLFDDEARLRVADFGLARALAEAASTEPPGSVLGTAKYASPEQASGEEVDGRSDIYSLAIVLVEALTGTVPFVTETTVATLMARIDQPLPVPAIAGPLSSILQAAGAVDPADRPDAAELAAGLLAAATVLDRPAPLPLAGLDVEVAEAADERERDDITVLGLGASTTVPDHDETAVVTEPGDREATRWGRRHLHTGATAVVEPDPDAPYDFMKESQPDFRDVTGPTQWSGSVVLHEPRRRRWPRRLGLVALALGVVGVVLLIALGFGTYPWQVDTVPTVAVPELTGRDVGEAQRVADANGWVLQRSDDRADGSVPGQVLSQEPAVGTQLQRGTAVHVRVSLGPTLVDVPAGLVGKTLKDATASLFFTGLGLGEVTRQSSEDVPADVVLSLGKDVRSPSPKGTSIPLVVSSGPPTTTVPGLSGTKQSDATKQLKALGFTVDVETDDSDTVPDGRVITTKPGAGAEAVQGSTITLVVSSGPADDSTDETSTTTSTSTSTTTAPNDRRRRN